MRAVLEKYTSVRNHTLMTFTITKMLRIPFSYNYNIIPKRLHMLSGPISKDERQLLLHSVYKLNI